jgi:hypothetical protein
MVFDDEDIASLAAKILHDATRWSGRDAWKNAIELAIYGGAKPVLSL